MTCYIGPTFWDIFLKRFQQKKILVKFLSSWSGHGLKVTIFIVLLFPRRLKTWTQTFREDGKDHKLSMRSEKGVNPIWTSWEIQVWILVIFSRNLSRVVTFYVHINHKFPQCSFGSKVMAVCPVRANRLYRQDINFCLGKPAYCALWRS